jgi:ankyrin repeat protein
MLCDLQATAPMSAASCDCATAHIAAATGHPGCLRYLFSNRSFATHYNSLGQTPLHLVQHSARNSRCWSITAQLLGRFPRHGAEIRAIDHTGATALDLTLQQPQQQQQQVGLDTEAAAAADVDTADATNGDAPAAVQHSSSFCLGCAEQLLQAGASVSSADHGRQLLCATLQHSSLDLVHIAASFVKLLQRQQHCPLTDLLRTAVLNCSSEQSEQDYIAVEVLLLSGADVRALDSGQGLTVLHQIVTRGSGESQAVSNSRLLRLLVHRSSYSSNLLHARTHEGNTALHLAYAHPEHVQTLLELGARVNERNTAGHTPLVNTYWHTALLRATSYYGLAVVSVLCQCCMLASSRREVL